MTLQKLKDFDQNYSETFGGDDIIGMNVYTDSTEEKIGTVSDVLVDEGGHFRYLIVDLGFWIFGKKLLLPVGVSRIDYNRHCVYARGMTKEQAENLPEFNENVNSDYDYEERVRNIYRKPSAVEASAPLESSTSLEASLPLEASKVQPTYAPAVATPNSYDHSTYEYEKEPSLYEMNEQDHQTLRLYEERLIAHKNRVKTGEVAVGKQVKTETSQVSVPVEKERVVIERTTPANAGVAVPVGENAFREGEVARMEIHEERPDVRKEAFVREEVNIRKEVERDTVNVQETLRREELDIDTDGNPIVKESR
jgi:uncharacterized protein (TIGR02271 family)